MFKNEVFRLAFSGDRDKIPHGRWALLPINDDSFRIRTAAFNYIATLGDGNALSFLDEMEVAVESDRSLIEDSRLQILIRIDPERAFTEIVAKEMYLSDAQLKYLSGCLSQVGAEALLSATTSSSEELRRLSLEELVRRGSLPISVAQQLTIDSSIAIRAIAFHELAAKGEILDFAAVRKALESEQGNSLARWGRYILGDAKPYPDADSIITTFFSTKSTEELLDSVDWFSMEGHLAYRALAVDRFETVAADLRSDLVNGFKRIRDVSSSRREKELGPKWEEIRPSWEKLDDFIRSQFEEAALIGMARHAEPVDADLLRPYLAKTNGLQYAVAIMAKIGNLEDAPALLAVAKEAYGKVKTDAALAAIKLSANPFVLAMGFVISENSALARVGFDWLLTSDSSDVIGFFRAMLIDKDEKNRVRGIHYLSARLPREELEEILGEYLERETYYYNVVTWLDRLLYSPPPLKHMFAKELEEKAK